MKTYFAVLVLVATLMIVSTMAAPAEKNLDVKIPKAMLRKYHPLLKKFGEKAKIFLRCMGLEWVENCVEPTLKCIEARNVVGCMELIVCTCKEVKDCVHHLRDEMNNSTTAATVC
ncbi:hypothetical protein BLA29_009285 [Euroglyphus maynei]|uniref:Uncharacterized protein n=1 Tax=Euroglyphus maynei TaxID=6958 RepID=A0A1Y3BHB9_EURMA|nr:hypothetical protein BLA29_009285 [Euroglyphus maynei]